LKATVNVQAYFVQYTLGLKCFRENQLTSVEKNFLLSCVQHRDHGYTDTTAWV